MCKLLNCNNDCHWCKRRKVASTPKPLKKVPIKKKATKIKRRSDKRAKEERKYSKEIKEWKKQNPVCTARLEMCTVWTEDVHHMEGRQNNNLLDKENWLPVCRNCHEWITKNSKQAIELGLSKRRIT